MLAYSKEKAAITVRTFKSELTEKETAGLQYIRGYVLHKLQNNLSDSKATQQAVALLKAYCHLLLQMFVTIRIFQYTHCQLI